MSFTRLASVVFALAAFFAAVPLAHAAEVGAAEGLAVVATDGATDAAWPLASAIYGDPSLHPISIDDARARVLAGEAPTTAATDLADLAELRGGVKGDDAASREVLAAIAQRLAVRAIVVVFAGPPPTVRVFDVASHAFDAARYEPDAASSEAHPSWNGALRSLERAYLPARPTKTATARVVAPLPSPVAPKKDESKSKAFYESPWFWVAIGAAALIGGGALIATNIQSGDTIHLQLKLP